MLMVSEIRGAEPVGFIADELLSGGAVWYALLIEPQQEVRTYRTLQSYRVRTCMPLVPHWTTRGVRRTKVQVFRPMLRGYLLVREDSVEDLRCIRQPLPVHGFLRFGDCIAVVSQRDIDRLTNIEQELAKPKPIQSIWDVGEVVRINEGPFMGFNATITDLANGERIKVDVPFMKRAVSMTLDAVHLDKL